MKREEDCSDSLVYIIWKNFPAAPYLSNSREKNTVTEEKLHAQDFFVGSNFSSKTPQTKIIFLSDI